ncbi:MAG: chromosome segregation protein SMC, partial [Rhodospirillales bacterium]|nr:chromosome segregation protein SMC [Rhodospirillales bacterium]
MRFSRLRLSGFKSFVEPTDLLIERGLTGVVGPNGCGKSNLVEALRWVMGESSAKQMRGGEMDDVIFGGTRDRPPRNVAEVILSVENDERNAPAQFNDLTEIEVSRRIERGSGSTYRVNSKEVRARDVQLLFADAATGPRSNALVSQGRIGNIISAKPTERRVLLEEAAGITGLHSRRHEAELRLRGAETNLVRLEDVLGTLEVQLKTLKKQARQASRYRNLSGHIRKAEAILFHLRWIAASQDLEIGRESLTKAQSLVAELTGITAEASTRQAECAAALPPFRQAEAEAAAELQRITLAREGLDAEEQRISEARRENEARLNQIDSDVERERGLADDAATAMRRLESETTEIVAAREGEEGAREEAKTRLETVRAAVNEQESRHGELTARIAEDEAQRTTLARRIEEQQRRAENLAKRAAEISEQRASLEARAVNRPEIEATEKSLQDAAGEAEKARARLEEMAETRLAADAAAREATAARHQAEAALARLEAESKALSEVLEAGESDMWPPMIDSVTVDAGFETALGTALGEDLSAPSDDAAPVHWNTLPPLTNPATLPAGCQALGDHVKAPAALARRLSQIGVVESDAEGARLASDLSAGQRLVSKEGGLWRWDGFTMSAGAPTAAAARLEQRNRLADIRAAIGGAEGAARDAAQKADRTDQAARDAAEAERNARDAANAANALEVKARQDLSELRERASAVDSRLSGLADTIRQLEEDRQEAETQATDGKANLDTLPDPAIARAQAEELRTELAERRGELVDAQSTYESLDRLARERQSRQLAINDELLSWRQRGEGAAGRLEALTERREQVEQEGKVLDAKPAEIAEKRGALLGLIEEAEKKRNTAADRLAEAEGHLAKADGTLREAESALAAAREDRIRSEGAVEQAEQAAHGLSERIQERLECRPTDLAQVAELKEDAELPSLEDIERRVDRLHRERETMGPVNLRAEQEANELGEQIETLEQEKGDLIKAIEKLRRGIAELNREGRQRLVASFEEVDGQFRALFVRLFGGGRAHLALTESDDPLEAGLEIMASPPGKRLQVLSLLSGGEQALTALALMFAVFLTNPAPICVLDEVDAPLDDANVDRFCTLVEELARAGRTKFLVITHHRMT